MNSKLLSTPTILFLISGIANILFVGYLFFSPTTQHTIEQERAQYSFLSQRIFLTNQNDLLINFTDLRTQLQQYTTPLLNRIGVYFEYLPSGTSIGINEKESFIFASLLKIPMIMAIYQQIEKGTLKPDTMLTIQEQDLDFRYGNLWKKGVGQMYSVFDLIKYTLIESDNTASNMLFRQLPAGAIDAIFDQLDIPKSLEANGPVVTAKNYSSILRSLYLSSILTKEHSEEMLAILSKAPLTYTRDTIPESVAVAHKIGVYGSTNPNKNIFSDCGIFYPPKRPYILCIMTETNEANANVLFPAISTMVYSYVTKTNIQ